MTYEEMCIMERVNLKQEVIREGLSHLLASFVRYFKAHKIDPEDNSLPAVQKYLWVRDTYNNIFDPKYDSLEAIISVGKEYRAIKGWLDVMKRA